MQNFQPLEACGNDGEEKQVDNKEPYISNKETDKKRDI